jgi:hypothetical protein
MPKSEFKHSFCNASESGCPQRVLLIKLSFLRLVMPIKSYKQNHEVLHSRNFEITKPATFQAFRKYVNLSKEQFSHCEELKTIRNKSITHYKDYSYK